MKTFCTIVTADYLPFAKVLLDSLRKRDTEISLQVLVIGTGNMAAFQGMKFYSVNEVAGSALGRNIFSKYEHKNSDHFRWALKPLFISHLLQNGFEKIIYADPDIYFVNNFDFLFDQLNESDVLLTPHWSNTNPLINESGLYHILRDGLFNAGLIGANQRGLSALVWWAEMCYFKLEKDPQLGLFDDQKYLDILSVQFENVGIVRHRGCNLASWNIDTCRREIVDGKLIINHQFEPVFIHFAKETIANIINHNDKYLIPYLEEYSNLLKNENFDLHERFNDLNFSKMNSKVVEWKHRLRIRTRLKRFLYKLAETI